MNDSPSPPDSSTSVGSPSQRVTIDIPAPAAGGGALLPASLDKPTLPSEAEAEQSEGRPMSMDLGGRPISMMSVDMTPASPSIMGGVPLWTPGTGEAQWLASPGTSMGGQQMWSTMPPVSPGTHGNMWVMPPSPSATLKVNSPSATAPVPVWSQAPPTAGSSTTPGWPTLFSTCVRPRAKCSVCSACFFDKPCTPCCCIPLFHKPSNEREQRRWSQLSSTPWTTTPSAATPFWHSTPSGSVPQMWPE